MTVKTPPVPVLAVDDRPENLTALEALFQGLDVALTTVGSGDECLRRCLREDYALVLLDVQMPGMDGFEVAELLRANPRTRSMPIVFITAGMKEDAYRFKGYEAGAVDYLTKPIEPQVLLGKVKVFCELYRQHRALMEQEQQLQALVQERTAALRVTAEELRQSNERYQRLLESIINHVYTVQVEGEAVTRITHRPSCEPLTGYGAEAFEFDPDLWERLIHEEDCALADDALQRLFREKRPVQFVHRIIRRDGDTRWVENTLVPFLGPEEGVLSSYDAVVTDITGRKLAEHEREKLQVQLHQVQKMDSVGCLAGAIAHDFNNMLSAILGYCELVLAETKDNPVVHADMLEIEGAARRSALLTRQLLAFASKQEVAPQRIDMNEIVTEALRMLRRLIGENVELKWRPSQEELWLEIDPCQFDQLLTNLCINGRDAIGGVGRIVIETSDVPYDPEGGPISPDAAPEDYVRLTVRDTGCGMDAATLERIYEPFFTTKELGKGTGLGLATVYGIVKQNRGFITVESTPGEGTTFSLYFPRRDPGDVSRDVLSERSETATCNASVLVVEDEASILQLSTRILTQSGYHVHAASTPREAIALAEQNRDNLQLLVTDVVMPEMNGKELSLCVSAICPAIKTLYISGYTADIIARHGLLDSGIHFLQKPFTGRELLDKVQAVLENGNPGVTHGPTRPN